MKTLSQKINSAILFLFVIGLFGCGGGGGDGDKMYSINQAAWDDSQYTYGHNTTAPNIIISKAPDDTDFKRWAALHDGDTWRVYFLKKGSNNTIYQFSWNGDEKSFEYGFNTSNPELLIINIPTDANPEQISMLNDGGPSDLYMRSKTDNDLLYRFSFDSSTESFDFNDQETITGAPEDTDYDRWAVMHDGTDYWLNTFKEGSDTVLHEFLWDGDTFNYTKEQTVEGLPTTSDTSSFAMLSNTIDYAFYVLQED